MAQPCRLLPALPQPSTTRLCHEKPFRRHKIISKLYLVKKNKMHQHIRLQELRLQENSVTGLTAHIRVPLTFKESERKRKKKKKGCGRRAACHNLIFSRIKRTRQKAPSWQLPQSGREWGSISAAPPSQRQTARDASASTAACSA